MASDDILKELLDNGNFPVEYEEEKKRIDYKGKRIYSNLSQLSKYTFSLDRDQSKEFFSIYKGINPKLDRVWFHLYGGRYRELTTEETDGAYYGNDKNECKKYFEELVKEFKGESYRHFFTRRISVLFGDHDVGEPLSLKIVYFQNARPQSGRGILRLYFYYYTYDNSVMTNIPLKDHKAKYQKPKLKKKRKVNDDDDEDRENDPEMVEMKEGENISMKQYAIELQEAYDRQQRLNKELNAKYEKDGITLKKEYLAEQRILYGYVPKNKSEENSN